MKRERQNSSVWFVLIVVGFWGLSGCEDSVRNPAQVRPPQIAPQPVQEVFSPLPLLNTSRGRLPELITGAPDGVERLVASSRASIEAGELDYRAGNVGRAREELGQAVDQLQNSGYDAQNDPQLTGVYHQLVESAQAKEKVADASPTGDSMQEQQTTPAPIDEIAEVPVPETETPDPTLLGRAEGEVRAVSHDMPLTVNDRVLMYLKYFQSPRGSAIVETGLRRAGRYRDMVERVLREEGMPQDLIYLAQAESAFQPQAVSKAGARGMWQFMAFSGRKYGLTKNTWVDERQDPEQATRAAARYLRALYDEFGDWYLAMAGYNSGAGTIEHAVERTGYSDFWELYRRNVLPKETQNYVPIILALTLISKDPARYGIEPQPEPAFQADVIKPGQPVDLRLVADTLDTDVDTLRSLNPQLLRLATPADPNFVLRLPLGTGDRFLAEMAAIPPEKWGSWRRHKVEEGETLNAIAKRYRVPSAAITEANNLEPSVSLEAGQKLIIPMASPSDATADKMVRYRVRHPQTVASIADEFDVTSAELRNWNHLRSDHVARGTLLRIYSGGMTPLLAKAQESPSAAAQARRLKRTSQRATDARSASLVHHVKPGETLWSIAHAYQTTAEAIRSTNKYLFSRPLEVGDSLTILSPR
jgi:peptidoglycan lytic transglycosylase D